MKNQTLDSTDLTWLARLARGLLGEANAADDLAQETAIAALEGGVPAEGQARRAWLGSVARRLAARHWRERARRTRRELRAARSDTLPDSSELVERAEIAEQVTAAARALPEPFRRAILLRFLEGLSPEEIARQDGKPVDTVRWRVRRGLALLRAELVRRSGRDWSSWSVLLVPLAHSRGAAGLAATGTSGTLAGLAAALLAMKTTLLVTAAALGCAGLLVWFSVASDPTRPQGPAERAAAPATPPAAGSAAGARQADVADRTRVEVAGPPDAAAATAPAAAAPNPQLAQVFGRVIDDAGAPVPDTTVYLVPTLPEDRDSDRQSGSGTVVARGVSDGNGRFRIRVPQSTTDEATAELDLGAAANGFLRRIVTSAWPARADEELVVALERGQGVLGVVVDEYDRPVPGLELLCHTTRAGIAHVSPSQMMLRSERAVLGDAASRYEQCRGRTDQNGMIELRGLPTEELVVRSLDPGWIITNPRVGVADGGYRTWVARRQLGVRLTVVDARTGRPIDRARATFCCEMQFADGDDEDNGQWVGRGRGGATFVLTSDLLPGLDDRVVTRAVFYGTVRANDSNQEPVAWRAEPLVGARGASGVAELRVAIEPDLPDAVEEAPQALPTATLDIDVRYIDGAPFDRELYVRWRTRTDLGAIRQDGDRAERLAPGRYRMEVVAGDVELEVRDSTASGSLAPWTGAVRCEPDRSPIAYATLPRGATATIARPEGWSGPWYLRASWRSSPDDEWFGSWNYGTPEDVLVLTALRPAEWRFELRRDSEADPDPLVRTAVLAEGVQRLVDR